MSWTSVFIFFIITLAFSILTNKLLLKFSTNMGRRITHDNEVRWAKDKKPALGGLTFFILFLLSVISFIILDPEGYILFRNIEFVGFLLSVSIGFLTGLFDDAFNTRPLLKFSSQVLAGLILVATGTYIHLTELYWFDAIFTIFWVVGIMNAINLLDNMDAISSVTSIGILCSILIVIMLNGNEDGPYAFIIIGMVAALGGFLVYNWHPSKMFMGDTGSMLLGVILAFLGIKYAWNMNLADYAEPVSLLNRILLVFIIFILPITDTTTVFFKRISAGHSPFKGGKDHTTHHLFYLGLKESQVALIFLFISILSILFVLKMIPQVFHWNAFFTIGYLSYAVIVFGALFFISHLNRSSNHYYKKTSAKDKKSA